MILEEIRNEKQKHKALIFNKLNAFFKNLPRRDAFRFVKFQSNTTIEKLTFSTFATHFFQNLYI